MGRGIDVSSLSVWWWKDKGVHGYLFVYSGKYDMEPPGMGGLRIGETEHCFLESRKVNLLETLFKIAWHD